MAVCPVCGRAMSNIPTGSVAGLAAGATCHFCNQGTPSALTASLNLSAPAAAPAPTSPALSPAPAPTFALTPSSAAAVAPAAAPADVVELPQELRAFVSELEQWATANAKDARRDTWRFWSLKAPAVASSALAGVLALAHLGTVAAVLAGVASACIVIDAVNPGGQLRNAHVRALYDLRDLEHQVMNEWRIGRLNNREPGNRLAAKILQSASQSRDKIAAELRQAETSFARTVDAK